MSTLVITCGFMAIFLVWHSKPALVVATAVGICGMASPTLAAWIHKVWMGLGKAIGFVTSKILLSLIYFLVVFPIGLLAGYKRKDPLHLKPGRNSIFEPIVAQNTGTDFKKPW